MPQTIIPEECRFRYEEAYRKWQQREAPEFVRCGGYLKCKFPDVRTGSGLNTFIRNFLEWNGHAANRINTVGRQIKGKDGQMKWIKGTTRNGTADIDVVIFGRAVKIEGKAGNDRPRPEQLREQARIRASQGIYEFIHTPDELILWYDNFILSLK